MNMYDRYARGVLSGLAFGALVLSGCGPRAYEAKDDKSVMGQPTEAIEGREYAAMSPTPKGVVKEGVFLGEELIAEQRAAPTGTAPEGGWPISPLGAKYRVRWESAGKAYAGYVDGTLNSLQRELGRLKPGQRITIRVKNSTPDKSGMFELYGFPVGE